jgi:hypothetical protein
MGTSGCYAAAIVVEGKLATIDRMERCGAGKANASRNAVTLPFADRTR